MGTSDVGGTAKTVAFSGDPTTGAQYVYNLGPAGSVTLGNTPGGTLNRIGSIDTIGTLPSISTTVNPNLPVIAGTPADPGTSITVRLTDGTNYYTASGGGGGSNVNILTGSVDVLRLGTITQLVGTAAGTIIGTTVQNIAIPTSGKPIIAFNIGFGGVMGTPSLSFQATTDNTNWFSVPGIIDSTAERRQIYTVTNTSGAGQYIVTNKGYSQVRLSGDMVAGTCVVAAYATEGNDVSFFTTFVDGVSSSINSQRASLVGGYDPNFGILTFIGIDANDYSVLTTLKKGTLSNLATGSLSNVAMLNAGTVNIASGTLQNSGNGTMVGGTLNNLVSGTLQSSGAGTVTTGTLQNLVSGTINALASGTITGGTIQNVAGGTVISPMPSGTLNVGTVVVTLGTVGGAAGNAAAASGNPNPVGGTDSGGTIRTILVDSTGVQRSTGTSVMSVGTLTAGTLTNLISGTINALAAGTVTAGTLTNLVSGTINALAAGTITGGTLGNLNNGTLALVSTVTTVSNLTNGSVNLLTGTVTRASNVGTLESGTIKIDPTTIPTMIQQGTLGTAGGSFFGTLSGASGAGTKHYVQGVDIVMNTGTADLRILAGTSIQGTGVLTAGNFIQGGGISKNWWPHFATGTNSELIYHFVGAGTAFITISYWKGV